MSTPRTPPREVAVLYRDEQLLVVSKPPFLSTTSPRPGDDTLVGRVRALDPRAPKHHPSSRLDAEVTGVVIFARTAAAVRHLLEARREGLYARVYVGLAAAAPEPPEGEWRGAIAVHARDPRKRVVVEDDEDDGDARESCTRYRTLAQLSHAALLRLEPQTGRTHQLRVHAAHAGCALLGDKPYGGTARVVLGDGSVVTPRRVMLHCAQVTVPAMDRGGEAMRFAAPVPEDMQRVWAALGGAGIAVG
jgi:23S rRNA pseudouridine1911/1915/1917 synthase